jgi:glycosyltransferase involved in cell wall biosynthesis
MPLFTPKIDRPMPRKDSFSVTQSPDTDVQGRQKVYINGRCLVANPTGVHRVAEELIKSLDHLITVEPNLGDGLDITILAPVDSSKRLDLDHIRTETAGKLKWLAWEQFDLPRLTRDGLCVNLCNIGALASRNAITMFHDAQVYSTPKSYSKAFRTWYRFAQPFIGSRHKRILTVSNFSKSELVKYGTAPDEKIYVIANGCDHVLNVTPDAQAVERLGLQGKAYILALSSTQAHKNIGVLFKAFAEPSLKGVSLALFGSANKKSFEEMGYIVPENTLFLGRVTDQEMVALMKGAIGFACPSRTEGFGLPPLEAMALGCPVISAPCGALPEVCGDAALMADPDDSKSWAWQINRLINDPRLNLTLRAKGRHQASLFTWDRAARELLAQIHAALGRRPRQENKRRHDSRDVAKALQR